jgi:hypothetical protein
MHRNSLEKFVAKTWTAWGDLSTELVAACRANIEELMRASADEPWLASLHHDEPAARELHRDPHHGFLLLAHTEAADLYRPPHDHGRSWVIYAVQKGEIEMGTYARVEDAGGAARLVKRNSRIVRAGEAAVFLPGDIHDTKCVSGPALLFRFTERDLKKEDTEQHRVTRYYLRDGVWIPKAA